MKIEIKELSTKDFDKPIQYAIKGMHFNWYIDNKFILNLYGRYFWYLETSRATQVIAAYIGDELVGVLLAEIKGETKKYNSFGKRLFVKIFDFLQNTFFKDSAGAYEVATKRILESYLDYNNPDGEIIFLAANPDVKIKGIGTALLLELERRENGKTIFLHTDDGCTYQFYEHLGFERVIEKDIILELDKKQVPLKCLLYSKIL